MDQAQSAAQGGDQPASARPAPRTLVELAQAGLIIEDEGRTRLGDEFRICASRLHATIRASILSGDRNGNAVLVTSTKPAEGKSFSALNLAAALTQAAPRPVVLVDADLKPGSLTELVGLRRKPGLFDMVADTSLHPSELVVATPLPGLSMLPIGVPFSQTDLDHRRRPLVDVVDALCSALPDCTVMIDTGPLLSTSDPSLLATSVAQVVMVVEAERTQQSELTAALDLIRGAPKVTLMLNKVTGRARTSFGAYSYYGDYYARPNAPPGTLKPGATEARPPS